MSHTKGRLEINQFGGIVAGDGDSLLLAGVRLTCGNHPDRAEAAANARRIVALWNAAKELELTTEEIEAGAIQDEFDDGYGRLVRAARRRSLTTPKESDR